MSNNIDKVNKRIKDRFNDGRDLTPVHKVIGVEMRKSILKNFRVGGRPKMWKASKKVWGSFGKGGAGYKRHTLVGRTGNLKRSITYYAGTRQLRVGSYSLVYNKIHHFGGNHATFLKMGFISLPPYLF